MAHEENRVGVDDFIFLQSLKVDFGDFNIILKNEFQVAGKIIEKRAAHPAFEYKDDSFFSRI